MPDTSLPLASRCQTPRYRLGGARHLVTGGARHLVTPGFEVPDTSLPDASPEAGAERGFPGGFELASTAPEVVVAHPAARAGIRRPATARLSGVRLRFAPLRDARTRPENI